MFTTEFEKVSLWLQSWNEAELRQSVLMPLLIAQGYQGISEFHGTTEFGKDIVAWEEDAFGLRRNIAVVAKAKKLTSEAVQVELFRQILQALNSEYPDPENGQPQTADIVLVITNHRVKLITRTSIYAMFESKYHGRIHIIDLEQLAQRWMKYFPFRVAGQLARTQQLLAELDSPLRTRIQVDESEQQFQIYEREPNALSEEDRRFTVNFEFPDTPEGRLLAEEVRNSYETGEPLRIDGPFMNFQLPRILMEHLVELGIEASDTFDSIQIDPVPDTRRFPYRIEFIGDDGVQFSLDYVEFTVRQGGSRVVTVSNADQPIPLRFEQVVDFGDRTVTFRASRPTEPIPAYWYSRFTRTLARMSRPGWFKLISLETGLTASAHRSGGNPENSVPDQEIEVALMLEQIEQGLAQSILVPQDGWTSEDVREIVRLADIVENPTQQLANARFSITCETTDIEALVGNFGPSRKLVFIRGESSRLFGQDLDLGRVQYVVEGPTLVDWEAIELEESGTSAGKVCTLNFRVEQAELRYVALGAPPMIDEDQEDGPIGFREL